MRQHAVIGLFIMFGPSCSLAWGQPLARLADEQAPFGEFRFSVRDGGGTLLPSRLTFVPADDSGRALFVRHDALPDRLAVRERVVYSIDGTGLITVPAGMYTVYASRGIEYGIDTTEIEIRSGERAEWEATVARDVDTEGWISGDFHLHTLTYSGHGDSNMPERIISLIGEGVEFAVATDHNHNTDYTPEIERLGAGDTISAVVGNEISTPVGHFNAFPLDSALPTVPSRIPDANTLFALIREEPNEHGVEPVIQLNHPRWGNINYFGLAGLDPVLGVSTFETYSDDFDSVEVFNENEGWGYYDPDEYDGPIGSGSFSVLRDWFNLLNRGHRAAAVGNSDSHTVFSEVAGIPRNFVMSSTDSPGDVRAAEVAGAIRDKRTYTTSGPIVEFTVNGVPMGSLINDDDGSVEVGLRIQAASWVSCDRARVIVNGEEVDQIQVSNSRDRVRLDTVVPVRITRDSWVTVLVEGDRPLAPIMPDQERPIVPLAVMNPVWIDADGDGSWTSPVLRVKHVLGAAASAEELVEAAGAGSAPSAELALMLQYAAQSDAPAAADLISLAMSHEDRWVRLSAARCTALLADRFEASQLTAWHGSAVDLHSRVWLLHAMNARGIDVSEHVLELAAGVGPSRFHDLVARFVSPAMVSEWSVVGFFPNSERTTLTDVAYGPERDPDASGYIDARSGKADWVLARADDRGYVNLRAVAGDPEDSSDAIAYAQTWLVSPDDRDARYTFGSDDGSLLWINGQQLVRDTERHGADPLGHIGTVRLRQGANRVLVKIENSGGDFGFYFGLLDGEVGATSQRP